MVLRKPDGTPLTLDDLPGGKNNPHEPDLRFLHSEVHRAGEYMRRIDPGQVFGSMTCQEAEALADVFAAAGDQATHDHIIDSHSRSDDDPEDDHHDLYLKYQEERYA